MLAGMGKDNRFGDFVSGCEWGSEVVEELLAALLLLSQLLLLLLLLLRAELRVRTPISMQSGE